MTRPVLIFNAVQHVVIAVSRSLHRHGIPVTFADISGGRARHPFSRAIQNFVRLPNHRETPDEFIDALSKLIQTGNYDTLIPCSDPGLVAVSEHYDLLAPLLYVCCPPPDIVRRVLDKSQTLEAAMRSGILTPETYNLPDIDALEELRREPRFPLIAKPLSKVNENLHTFKMRYFESFEDLQNAFIAEPLFGARNLLQEYCVGEGVGIELLLHEGEPLAIFQHRRLREFPVTGGGSVASVSEPLNPVLVEQAVTLLREIGWQGVAMVEFRYDPVQRRAVLMEVNGRYWGSLPLAISAGFEFPFYEWQLAHGEMPSPPVSYRPGLPFRWLSGDIRRVVSLFSESPNDGFPRPSKWSESFRFVTDFAAPTCPAIWSWRDPLAALAELKDTIKSIVGGFLRRIKGNIKRTLAQYRYLGRRNTIAYLRLHALHAIGLKRNLPPRNFTGIRSVLFVCHGNIIRSPMAEALLHKYLADFDVEISVSSAGFIEEPEEQADQRARILAREFGVSLDDHRPRALTPELIEQTDIIFIMDYLNEARMRVRYPLAKSKTFYLGAYTADQERRCVEIADPNLATLADVRRCYQVIDAHVQKLFNALIGGVDDLMRREKRSLLEGVAD